MISKGQLCPMSATSQETPLRCLFVNDGFEFVYLLDHLDPVEKNCGIYKFGAKKKYKLRIHHLDKDELNSCLTTTIARSLT